MIRRFAHAAISVGLYVVVVIGGTLLVLIASSLIGYLPYSDRPGPGWHSAGLTKEELRFFLSWSTMLLPGVAFWGAVLAILGQALALFRSPRWFLALIGALLGGYLALLTVASVGWYIAIAAAPVYVAGVLGVLFGVFVLPRVSIGRVKQPAPSRLQWLGIATLTVGAVAGTYLLFLAPRYSQQLSLEFIRVEPSEQQLEVSLEKSSLTDAEKNLLKTLFPHGIVRFGMTGFSGGGGGASARMLIVVTDRLPARSKLQEPKGGSLVYVQSGAAWKRYPEGAKLLSDTVEFWPAAHESKVAVKYGIGEPTEFAWFIPRP